MFKQKVIPQKALIIHFLRDIWNSTTNKEDTWVNAYDLRGKNTTKGFLGHQADRRARELANENRIEHRVNNQGFAQYRYLKPIPETEEQALQRIFSY